MRAEPITRRRPPSPRASLRRGRLSLRAAVVAWTVLVGARAAASGLSIGLEQLDDRVRVTIDGALFTEYRHGGPGRTKPILAPVVGPGGLPLTRSWPVGPRRDGEPDDHPHHESLWFAHGDVNGHDFWTGRAGARIEHVAIDRAAGGEIEARCRWLAPDGTVVCSDRRTMRFSADVTSRAIDHEITITADHGPVVFGDTKEGTMALRVRPELAVKTAAGGPPATGHYVSATGESDGAVWGRPAAWLDLSGTLADRVLGVACFDHPANPRHPTTWHARDYGLFAANPFGRHDFTGAPPGDGRLELAAGESLVLRHRWLFHEGDAAAAGVPERFAAWTGRPVAPALPLVFTDDFSGWGGLCWEATDPAAWTLRRDGPQVMWGLNRRVSDYTPRVRSPHNIALVRGLELADVEITFRVRSTLDTGDHRDCCVFFGHRDPEHFYYVHLGAKPDPASGQIMIVDGAPRRPLTQNLTPVPWDDGWHTVKVVRDSESGRIEVYFDDLDRPLMTAVDRTFGRGRVGIGSFDDMNEFTDVRIRGR